MTERAPAPSPPALSLEQAIGCLSEYDPQAVPVDDACRVIARMLQPVQAVERLAVRAALGRVLASAVMSPIDVPAHDNSAMDGYAVRHADLHPDSPTRMRVAGVALAGRPLAVVPQPGEAVRVMTGAVMPEGTDTVVMQEVARAEDGFVMIPPGQQAGQNRRLRAEDLRTGTPALDAGRIVRPADLGLLASLGIAEVPVRRRLRVAFFSTGDELRSVGEPLAPGQVYDSNRYTLFGMLTRLDAELIDMGVVPDDPDALERAVRTAAGCADAIVSSGGVSVGEADFTRDIMARLGEVAFWTIAMRPGRPLAFGRIGDAFYFGLPGNPVAVMISFYFFVRPALLRLMGAAPAAPLFTRARSAEAMRKKPGRTEYQRGIVEPDGEGALTVRTTGSQGSGVLRSMSRANCIVVLHHDQDSVAVGGWVDCLLFDGLV
ncbi:MAG TPA: molybdopterin molybdotransferase MoeA [Burkholderiaceae bacterium]|nr:molybdopterin molybdotransferase MoeA [Burkholderiaceae bacterium]